MTNIEEICVGVDTTIIKVIDKLDTTSKKIILVVDELRQLLGIVTDGDFRRWVLKNGDLYLPVTHLMNSKPIVVRDNQIHDAQKIMQEKFIDAIPVIDENNTVIDVVFWNVEVSKKNNLNLQNTDIVIMAGGKGTRLYPYTHILPKPLVPIGEIPIVERIIDKFLDFGAKQFYMTVNYKKNMIKSYFEEVDKNYELNYVEEPMPLGTGGSLRLIKDTLKSTFIISNCDILIEADYSDILNFHRKNNNKITMVTSLRKFQIPYGVILIDDSGQVTQTIEKPENSHLVNTGFYVVEPDVIEMIPDNQLFHFTQLIDECLNKGIKVGTYPINEGNWLDMGELSEMERMVEKLGYSKSSL